jgi:hypothetical protein
MHRVFLLVICSLKLMFHVVDGKTFKKINSTHFEYIFGYYMVPEAGPDCLSASLCRVAQQSERRRRCCPSVRPVSGAAK